MYLFKFSACLLVFWLVYILVLERQKMHHLKRFYLLGSVVLALIIPILTITYYVEPVVTNFEVSPLFIPIEPEFTYVSEEIPPFWNLEKILWLVYGIGVFIFSSRFIINLVKMYQRISGHTKVSERSFIYVLLQELRIPHSFFNYIFLNKSKYEVGAIPKEVILHEETHAKQLHSLDVMAIELLQIIFWFHPLVYILKHHIKLNHEFLADQAVLEKGIDTKTYQNILLQFSSKTQEYQLSSAINYSSIKKRFTVMKTQTSKTRIWLSSLLLLPIIAILFYSFAEKEYVQKDTRETSEVLQIENVTTNEGATEAMMLEYNDWIKKLNSDSPSLFIPVGTWERLVAIYDLMSQEQRNSVETDSFLQEIITPALYSVEPSIPKAAQFESWKNEKEFAIWLDNKHTPNSELNNYNINDIAHYVGSSVNTNAKSKKFPQPFQFRLYTKDGFNKFYKEAYVSGYRTLTKTYSNAINTYLKGSQTDSSELRIIKAQADKFYNQFTKEQIKKHNILPVPPVPAQKNYAIVQKPVMWILINRKNQFLVNDEIGTLESIENELKKLAKKGKAGQLVSIKYDKKTSKDIILKVEELVKLNKFKVASFDESKIPPPPPPKKTKGGPNVDELQNSYNPSFLEYIIEMEKDGASFYLDGKKITSNEAKSITKNNKGKSTEMLTQKDANGKYVVKLSSSEKNKIYARSIDLKILNDNSYLVDGIKATKRTFTNVFNQLHQDITPETRNKIMNIHVSSTKEISNKEVWFIYNSLLEYGFHRIVTDNQEINRAKGNTPFAVEMQNQQTIKTININVDKDYNILLNGKLVKFKNLAAEVNKVNPSISDDDKRNFVESSILLPDNSYIDFSKKIMAELRKANIFQNYSGYAKNMKNSGLKVKHFSLNDGLSVEEAKTQRKQIMHEGSNDNLRKKIDNLNKNTNSKWSIKVDTEFIEDNFNNTQEKATAKQVADYNAWAKQLKTSDNKIIKKNDLKKYKHIYSIMTAEQKKNSIAFPKTPPPPPPAPKVKKGESSNIPPPPPAPESTLDFVIHMAKTNAKFFYKLKPISSDKAIEILKKKPKTHINAQKTDTREPLIYMSNKPIHIGTKGKSKN